MLRSCCGRFRQGTECAQVGFARPPRLLRGSVDVQRGSDGVILAKLAANAISAGHGLQQRRQHHPHGPPGLGSVRGSSGAAVAAGRGLHPAGPNARDSRRFAGAAPAAAGVGATAARAAAAAATAGAAATSAPAAGSAGGGVSARSSEALLRRPRTWTRSAVRELMPSTEAATSAAAASPWGCSSSSSSTATTSGETTDPGTGASAASIAPPGAASASAPGEAALAAQPSSGAMARTWGPASCLSSSGTAAAASPGSCPAGATRPSPLAGPAGQPSHLDGASGLGQLGRFSYRLIISYDGTDYCGWQLQPAAPTVQRCLEAALCMVLREQRSTLGVRAAGRTDSGVHASGQVVQFSCNRELDVSKMPYKMNSLLPHDIRVLRVSRTAPDFSVTCSALGKCYHYSLTNAPVHDPLRHRFAMHVRKPLDLAAMRTAAAALCGTHDFTQFSNIGEEGGRPRRRNPVKTLRRVDVVELEREAPGALRIEVEGNGFLYKMVRHISGALVAVGEGRLPVAAISRMIEIGNNEPPGCHGINRGYNVAPAKGLCLREVFYDARVDDPSELLYPNLKHDEYGRLLESIPDARSDDD